MMVFIKAFVIGGMICALTQILMEKTRLMPGRIMVLLVTLGTFLGAVGLYEPFAEFAGAGATVPLLGFGNVLWKGVREAVDANGFLGLFQGGFKACAVGVSAALIFGYLASVLFEPKMKKKQRMKYDCGSTLSLNGRMKYDCDSTLALNFAAIIFHAWSDGGRKVTEM